MDFKWINNQNLFPFINLELMNEIKSFAEGTKIATLKFSKAYNLEYIGELAERWHERNIVKDSRDLLALVMAVADCSSGTFLYDQKQLFIKSICEYLNTNWNPIAAAVILNYGRNELDKIPELLMIQDLLGQIEFNFACESERILLISLLSDFYAYLNTTTEIRSYVLNLIDGMQLEINDVHEEYPLLLLLSEVYGDLQKPTAKELKTKGMSRLLQVITALRTKEVSQEQDYHLVLGVSRQDITVLNFYLAYLETPRNHSITGPGFERIKENFIASHFTSEKDVPELVIKILSEMIKNYEHKEKASEGNSHPLSFLLRQFSIRGKKQFPNQNNLKLLIEMAKKILMSHVSEAYISLIKDEIVDSRQRDAIIDRLLTREEVSKESFDYLEQQRLALELEISVNPTYSISCLEHGYISLDQVDEMEKRGMLGYIIEYLKWKVTTYNDLLNLLERVPDSYHQFLVDDTSYNRLKSKMPDELKKRLYPIYLNALYTYRASKYPEEVFDMLKNPEFINLFELSPAELEGLERNLYRSNLLSESQAKSIREKYMAPEELEEVRTQELAKELKESSRYGIIRFVERHWDKFIEKEILRETFVEKLVELLSTINKSDVGDMLLLFYQLRARNILTSAQVETIEVAAIEKAEKLKIA